MHWFLISSHHKLSVYVLSDIFLLFVSEWMKKVIFLYKKVNCILVIKTSIIWSLEIRLICTLSIISIERNFLFRFVQAGLKLKMVGRLHFHNFRSESSFQTKLITKQIRVYLLPPQQMKTYFLSNFFLHSIKFWNKSYTNIFRLVFILDLFSSVQNTCRIVYHVTMMTITIMC